MLKCSCRSSSFEDYFNMLEMFIALTFDFVAPTFIQLLCYNCYDYLYYEYLMLLVAFFDDQILVYTCRVLECIFHDNKTLYTQQYFSIDSLFYVNFENKVSYLVHERTYIVLSSACVVWIELN